MNKRVCEELFNTAGSRKIRFLQLIQRVHLHPHLKTGTED